MIDLPVATRQPYDSKNPWYDGNIFIGLPTEFRPMSNTPDVAKQQIFMMTDGRIWFRTSAGSLRDRTEFNAVFIVARKAG